MLVLPTFGYTSHLLQSEARVAIVNSGAMLIALLTIGFISMVVYGHRLYTTGLDMDVKCYFSFATFLIAIPTSVKYFTWLSTLNMMSMLHSYVTHATLSFLCFFNVGGLTGVVLADGGLDNALHDAYYVVAHFHLVMAVAIMYAAAGLLLVESTAILS